MYLYFNAHFPYSSCFWALRPQLFLRGICNNRVICLCIGQGAQKSNVREDWNHKIVIQSHFNVAAKYIRWICLLEHVNDNVWLLNAKSCSLGTATHALSLNRRFECLAALKIPSLMKYSHGRLLTKIMEYSLSTCSNLYEHLLIYLEKALEKLF